MTISIRCDECGKRYRVRDERAGMRLSCTGCGAAIQVPDPEDQWETEPESRTTRADRGAKKRKKPKRSKQKTLILSIVGGTVVVLMSTLAVWEFRARSNHGSTLNALQEALREGDSGTPLKADDVANYVSGSPEIITKGETNNRYMVLKWRGVFGSYYIRLQIDAGDAIAALDTDSDMEKGFDSEKVADAGSKRVVKSAIEPKVAKTQPKVRAPIPRPAPRQPTAAERERQELAAEARRLGIPVRIPRGQVEPQIVAKVSRLFKERPKSPLPAAQKTKHSGKPEDGEGYQVMMKDTVEAYKAYGRRSPKWDAAAIEFLTNYVRHRVRFAGGFPDRDTLVVQGKQAIAAGCTDALVLGLYAVVYPRRREHADEALKLFRQALQSLASANYPARCRYPIEDGYARLLIGIGEREQAGLARQRLIKVFVEAASAKDLTALDRRYLFYQAQSYFSGSLRGVERALVRGLNSESDPWISYMVAARSYHIYAWRARGNGFANSVTRKRMALFRLFMKQAQAFALVAWNLRPENPESAAHLIEITMAIGGVAGEDERFWFDQAVKAEFDYLLAYSRLRWALRPRWGGSHRQMLEFAHECLNTNRWDTDVPWQFHLVVRDIISESDDKRAAYRIPGVFEGYQKLFTETRKVAKTVQEKNRRATQLACVMWLSGRKADANKLLDSLGTGIDLTVFSQYFAVTLDEIRNVSSPSGQKPGSIPLSNIPTVKQQQPDEEIVAEVRKLVAKSPRSPLPASQKRKFPTKPRQYQDYQWIRKNTVEAYREHGRKNAKWDALAIEFLTSCAKLKAQYPGAIPIGNVIAQGKKTLDAGCDDPLVLGQYAELIARIRKSVPEAIRMFQNALPKFANTKYPPRCRFALEATYVFVARTNTSNASSSITAARKRCISQFAEAAAASDLTDLDKRRLAFYGEALMERALGDSIPEILSTLATTKSVDPWVVNMVNARAHHLLGWRARGNGRANTVTANAMKTFHAHMRRARVFALKAWKLHPEFPEAASHLIQITMAIGGVAGESPRFWFDQSVKAQLDQRSAFTRMRWALRPRWGGSHQKMIRFGRECLETGRYDIDIPIQFHTVIREIESELRDKRAIYKIPGVFEGFRTLFTEMEKAETSEVKKNRHKTNLACAMWLSGRKDEANKLLDSIGTGIDMTVFGSTFPVTLNEIRGMRPGVGSPPGQ